MATSTEIFAQNLKNMLYAKNKSQSDLARHLKVTATTVSRWTTAESLPRSAMIDRICNYLLCTPEDLLTDHTKQANKAPEDVLADAILERPILMRLFLMVEKASDEDIQRCIEMLGERK